MKSSIYLLPGRGGCLNQGLGAELQRRGFKLYGRELRDEFAKLPFATQVEMVADDLHGQFWHKDARVVANSFGAYLFLQAQAQLTPFPGRVLLLSPIVGEAVFEEQMMFFVPPRADKLRKHLFSGQYPRPDSCEIHVGEDDWQSNPTNVMAIGKSLGISVTVVPTAGHRLGPNYVGLVLDNWLNTFPEADVS